MEAVMTLLVSLLPLLCTKGHEVKNYGKRMHNRICCGFCKEDVTEVLLHFKLSHIYFIMDPLDAVQELYRHYHLTTLGISVAGEDRRRYFQEKQQYLEKIFEAHDLNIPGRF